MLKKSTMSITNEEMNAQNPSSNKDNGENLNENSTQGLSEPLTSEKDQEISTSDKIPEIEQKKEIAEEPAPESENPNPSGLFSHEDKKEIKPDKPLILNPSSDISEESADADSGMKNTEDAQNTIKKSLPDTSYEVINDTDEDFSETEKKPPALEKELIPEINSGNIPELKSASFETDHKEETVHTGQDNQQKKEPEEKSQDSTLSSDMKGEIISTEQKGTVHVRKRRKLAYASDIKTGRQVEGIFLALRKSLSMDKSGRYYLSVTLSDRTGKLDARLWEDASKATEKFKESDCVKVKGQARTYNGRLQLHLESIETVDIRELEIPASEFISTSGRPVEVMLSELDAIVEKISNDGLKALIQSFLKDPVFGKRFRQAPAAQSIHHAWIGGLLEHTLSVMKLCERLCDHYPDVNRDMVLAGAFFHDFGKIEELLYDDSFGYTDSGRLVGHIVMCCQWIHERARSITGMNRALTDRLVHIVASHHGHAEHGAPKQPQTLEALLVHSADLLDARMSSWGELLESAGPDGWTDFSRVYDRQLFRSSDQNTLSSETSGRKRKKRRKKPRQGSEMKVSARKTVVIEKGGNKPAKTEQKGRQKPDTKPEGSSQRKHEDRRKGKTPDSGQSVQSFAGGSGGKEKSRPPRQDKPQRKKATLTFNPFAEKLKDMKAEASSGKESSEKIPAEKDGE